MVEEKILKDTVEVSYSGLLNAQELYRLVKNYPLENGYTPHDWRYEEEVDGKKRRIMYELMPYKNITNYVKFRMHTFLRMDNVTEVTVEKDGKKMKLHKADVTVQIEGRLVFDWIHQWEKVPFFYLVRELLDQYIFRHTTAWFERTLTQEINHLQGMVKSYLNLYKN